MKFTEAQLEAAIIQLLGEVGYPHVIGEEIVRQPDEVLIKDDDVRWRFGVPPKRNANLACVKHFIHCITP